MSAMIRPPGDNEASRRRNRSVDEIDERILRMLEANGRATYEELGRYVSLSANAVRGRVNALRHSGILRGIHADVDWYGGGPKIDALIDIWLRPGANDKEFEQAAIELPGVVVLEHLTGRVSYQLRVAASSTDELDEVIRRIKEDPAAVETHTKIITRTLRRG
jgi:Lrp/AsnC family leucine-responsive transcriptional regulator